MSRVQVDEYNPFDALLRRYRTALATLESIGVRVSSNSRLHAYERRLQKSLDDPRPALEGDFVYRMAFDLREVDEVVEIVDFLPSHVDQSTLKLLKSLHVGSEDPDDETGAAAREAQYELYVGAVLRRAGIEARHGAPDLTARWSGREHYIEAKRPSSARKVDDRLRSAVHQLRALSQPGIIAISLDQVIRPGKTILSADYLDAVAPEIARLVQVFLHANMGMWRSRIAGEPVAALLLTARLPARLGTTGHLVLGSNVHAELIARDDDPSGSAAFIAQAVRAYMAAQR